MGSIKDTSASPQPNNNNSASNNNPVSNNPRSRPLDPVQKEQFKRTLEAKEGEPRVDSTGDLPEDLSALLGSKGSVFDLVSGKKGGDPFAGTADLLAGGEADPTVATTKGVLTPTIPGFVSGAKSGQIAGGQPIVDPGLAYKATGIGTASGKTIVDPLQGGVIGRNAAIGRGGLVDPGKVVVDSTGKGGVSTPTTGNILNPKTGVQPTVSKQSAWEPSDVLASSGQDDHLDDEDSLFNPGDISTAINPSLYVPPTPVTEVVTPTNVVHPNVTATAATDLSDVRGSTVGPSQADLTKGRFVKSLDDEGKGDSNLFGQEGRKDLSSLQPLKTEAPFQSTAYVQSSPSQPAQRAQLAEIVNQIVSQITTIRTEGQTDVAIVLKNPPMFEGAVVKISSFDQATGQFNISFENLAPQAKALLDLSEARDSLQRALEQKGYTVHILTATTQLETKIVTASENSGQQQQSFDQDGGRGGQQGRGRRQGQRGQEEEA